MLESKIIKKKELTKEQVKRYTFGNYDLTLKQMIEELQVSKEELLKLQNFLDELEEDNWISKSYCGEHNVIEYGPTYEQEQLRKYPSEE